MVYGDLCGPLNQEMPRRMKRAIVAEALFAGFVELALHSTAAALVAELPLLHRDPFDRVLVAQAITEPAVLYTADPRLAPYSELVRRVGVG